jgi:hypothetical protein
MTPSCFEHSHRNEDGATIEAFQSEREALETTGTSTPHDEVATSLLLAWIGGLLGLLLAPPLLKVLTGLVAGSRTLGLDVRIDWRTLAFTVSTTLLAGLVFGTLPAWRATRVNLSPALREGAASAAGGSPRLRTSRLLVSGK